MEELEFTPLDELSYEQALEELESLVEKLETSETDLQLTLQYFERGQALAGYCLNLLDSAELRVTQILEDEVDNS
ncbi:MAG: exodeoxyribonuclease VII small subunit [Anaerolineales bacterium]|nr:exodeoxyribonuclease VII small subunit [Anaerolineales bacterium]